jgi:hypothetical protein
MLKPIEPGTENFSEYINQSFFYVDMVISSKQYDEIIVLELKQTNSIINRDKVSQKALEQIKETRYADDYLSDKSIKKIFAIGLCFYKKTCVATIEQLKG